jgi:hypothetical protein
MVLLGGGGGGKITDMFMAQNLEIISDSFQVGAFNADIFFFRAPHCAGKTDAKTDRLWEPFYSGSSSPFRAPVSYSVP